MPIIIVVIAIAIGFSSQFFLGKDNEVEVVAEDVIQDETGVKINLDD